MLSAPDAEPSEARGFHRFASCESTHQPINRIAVSWDLRGRVAYAAGFPPCSSPASRPSTAFVATNSWAGAGPTCRRRSPTGCRSNARTRGDRVSSHCPIGPSSNTAGVSKRRQTASRRNPSPRRTPPTDRVALSGWTACAQIASPTSRQRHAHHGRQRRAACRRRVLEMFRMPRCAGQGSAHFEPTPDPSRARRRAESLMCWADRGGSHARQMPGVTLQSWPRG